MNEMDGMEEIIGEFLVEANEELDQFDRDLVELEKDPTSTTLLARIFRAIHTIKGSGGTLGFQKLAALSHVGENMLSRMRDITLVLSPEITTALLAMTDSLRQILAQIAKSGEEGDGDYTHVAAQLSLLLEGPPVQKPEIAPAKVAPAKTAPARTAPEKTPDPVPGPAPLLGELLVSSGAASPIEVAVALDQQRCGDSRKVGEILVANDAAEPTAVLDALKSQAETHADVSSNTIRVDVGLLDKLMNLVGELVLARNQILQFTATQKDAVYLGAAQRLNLITTELQEGVMKTRMQPIGTVWNKLPRIVRDLALSCGKSVQIEMSGAETELDKTIIEAIKSPLTHIIRNAVDHGIELPEVREANGKPREGRLSLRAFHEGGQVNIEISDDGAGIRTDQVKQKAIAKGTITADQAARMTERDILSLIFAPGISTARQVTNISGRGVGMDVVKTNIEKIGGAIDLQSTVGQGMTIKIKIPLTLAIIPALIVTSGGDRFAIPQVSLVELVRVEGEHAARGIESIQGTPVYRLRGRLLPIVSLNRELKLGTDDACMAESINIVVLQAGVRQFGLVVDEINDTEEIVVKPLSKQLKSVRCFAGATIMGDGRVALILDVVGLAQLAGVVSELNEDAVASETLAKTGGASAQQSAWLLFKAGANGRMAIPLSLVSRLEEFPVSNIECSAGRDVVQYRGQIMPLIRVSDVLGLQVTARADPLQVIVYSEGGRCIGLVVDEIVDIADQDVEVTREHCPTGILGTTVIQQHVTDLLDVHALRPDAALTAKGVSA
jgi:two-component system chemotaxis sensor kinase CheA